MNLKDELVLILYIWWHFTVHKMLFPVFSLDSFRTYLLRPNSVPGTLLGAWDISVNKIGGKSLTLCSLHFSECIWSSEPPKVELMDAPMNTLDLVVLSASCPEMRLPLSSYYWIISVLSASRSLSSERCLGSQMPAGDDEMVAVCFAWVPNKVFVGI